MAGAYGPFGFADCQSSASTIPAKRQPRLQSTLRPAWLRCLSASSLYQLAAPQPSALTDKIAITALFGLLGLSCLTAFGFGEPSYHRGFADCQPSASTVQANRQPRLQPTPQLSSPLCMSSFNLYRIAAPQLSALTDLTAIVASFGLYGFSCLIAYRLRPTSRLSWLHRLSALGFGRAINLRGLASCHYSTYTSCIDVFGSNRPQGTCGIAACQPPAYTVWLLHSFRL